MIQEGKIYGAICGVMEDIGAVGKNDINKQHGFKYRGIDSVMNALNPSMVKHKVFCTPEVLEQSREERTSQKGGLLIYSICKVRYRFFTTDGSYVEAVTVGEGMDSGDKATNKAMSIAFKYACFQIFCIPTEEMPDPDAETPEPEPKQGKNQKANTHDDMRVSPERVEILQKKCDLDGVDPGVILDYFHVNTFEELTNRNFNFIANNWSVVFKK